MGRMIMPAMLIIAVLVIIFHLVVAAKNRASRRKRLAGVDTVGINAAAILVNDLDKGIIIYNTERKCININRYAKAFFGASILEKSMEEMCMQIGLCEEDELRTDFVKEISSFNAMGEIYTVSYKRFHDMRGSLSGYAFIFKPMMSEIISQRNERFLTTHDKLTGLYNKEYFYYKTASLLNKNPDKQFLMICSNISQFKLINDIFGPAAGDRLLCNIGTMLRQKVREDAIYGRIESDKFALCLPKERFSNEMFEEVSKTVMNVGGNVLSVTNYFGIYEIDDRNISVDIMCDRAMMAINTIKGHFGKNVVFYNNTIRKEMLWEQNIISELPNAISKEQFEVYFQPQINPQSNAIAGAEALIRWNHPKRGVVPPSEFIPVFEKSGYIAKLDYYVWEKVCQILSKWKKEGRKNISVSVNISPKDFYYINIFNVFMELTDRYDIEPSQIKLEITESALMHDVTNQIELIKQLQGAGFIIEMDDFGSGYSSLNTLKDIPVNILKMDMKFLGHSENELRSRNILQLVVELGHRLDVPVIAEGVETAEEVEFLKGIGCEVIQGFYYAKPMKAEEFEALMEERTCIDIMEARR